MTYTLKGMSFRRKLAEVLESLNMKKLPKEKKYVSLVDINSLDLFKSFDRESQRYNSIIYLNESERQLLAANMLLKITMLLDETFNINVHIGCQTYIENGEEYGFLDLCVYDELSPRVQNIIVVLELKKGVDENGIGQLLSQLIAVNSKTARKVYGFLTSLDSWILFAYSKEEGIELFNRINCSEISRIDLATFKSVTEIIVDIVVNYCKTI